jgi:hypothetical protein
MGLDIGFGPSSGAPQAVTVTASTDGRYLRTVRVGVAAVASRSTAGVANVTFAFSSIGRTVVARPSGQPEVVAGVLQKLPMTGPNAALSQAELTCQTLYSHTPASTASDTTVDERALAHARAAAAAASRWNGLAIALSQVVAGDKARATLLATGSDASVKAYQAGLKARAEVGQICEAVPG